MSREYSGEVLRVVVDTSVFLAAILRSGLSEGVLRTIYEGRAELFVSRAIISELESKLATKPFQADSSRAQQALDSIKALATMVRSKDIEEPRLRDRDDLHILACAASAKANLIITLDKDLLSLKEFRGIGIVHPKTFRWTVGS